MVHVAVMQCNTSTSTLLLIKAFQHLDEGDNNTIQDNTIQNNII